MENSEQQVEANLDLTSVLQRLEIPHTLNVAYSGTIIDVQHNFAKVMLRPNYDMVCDDEGLVHSGFLLSSANWAAQVAVNKPYSVTVGTRTSFLAPIRMSDTVIFEATAYFEESRKREVGVLGHIGEIKVFEGTFQIVVLEDHIFKSKNNNT